MEESPTISKPVAPLQNGAQVSTTSRQQPDLDPGAVTKLSRDDSIEGFATPNRDVPSNGWTGYLSAVVAAAHFGVSRMQIARAEVELGRIDDAFVTLNSIVDNHDQFTGWLNQEPGLKPLHGDPRYVALLTRAGFR